MIMIYEEVFLVDAGTMTRRSRSELMRRGILQDRMRKIKVICRCSQGHRNREAVMSGLETLCRCSSRWKE